MKTSNKISQEPAAAEVLPSGSADKIVDAHAASTGTLAVSAATSETPRRGRCNRVYGPTSDQWHCDCKPGECPLMRDVTAKIEYTPETDAFYTAEYSASIPKEMLDRVIGKEKAHAEGLERRLCAARANIRALGMLRDNARLREDAGRRTGNE